MNVPAHPGASIPSAALVALPFFAGDANGDSGDRTLVGVIVVLVVLAVVLSIGLYMGRGESA
jgi:hypothetical protein